MKKIKFISILNLIIFGLLFCSGVNVKADVGPKNNVTVEIFGMEGKTYTATLISKNIKGPNRFYEGNPEDFPEFHQIMEYIDDEGYRYIGRHWSFTGDNSISWNYYPPQEFKLLILTNEGDYYVSNTVKQYAFSSYFKANVSDSMIDDGVYKIIIKNSYDYLGEILGFLIRLVLTIAIEIGIAYLFGFRKKLDLKYIAIINLITQFILNISLNLFAYFINPLNAISIYILLEFVVTAIETICYVNKFKDKDKFRVIFYTLLSNVLTFATGICIYFLLY